MERRVLIIMTTPLGLDGISNMVLSYFKHFEQYQLKYELAVWNDIPEKICSEIESRGGIIHKLPHRKKNLIQYYRQLKALIRKGSYSLVHAHGNSSTLLIEMLAAKCAGVKVRIAHSHSSMCTHILAHKILKPLFTLSYTKAFACSQKAGDWLFKDPYLIIKNAIELDKFVFKFDKRQKVRKALGINDRKVIGHIGNYTFAKNHDYLIDLFAALNKLDSSYSLVLIGEGERMIDIDAKIRKYGLNDYVLMLGIREDVPDLLQAMDLFLMPSRFEGLPLVLLEAQAAGLPCIVSDNITKEANLTGLINYVSIEQPPEVWANIIKDLHYGSRSQASIQACKDLQEAGYDITLEAKKLEALYLSLIEGYQ